MGFDNLSDKVNEFTNRKKELQADSDIFDLENQQVNDIFDMLNSSDAEIVKAVQNVHGAFDAESARLQLQKELAEESKRDLVKEIGDEKKKLDAAGSRLAALKGKKYTEGVNAAADKCADLEKELNDLLSQLDESMDSFSGSAGGSGGGDVSRTGMGDISSTKASDSNLNKPSDAKSTGSDSAHTAAGDQYDHPKQLYSSFEDRVKYTPAADNDFGKFTGERGNSFFQFNQPVHIDYPSSKDISGIPYKNGVVDFSSVSASTVTIKHMTSDLTSNYAQAYTAIAKKWNKEGFSGRSDWKPRDVKQWCKEHSYTVHECSDRRHCQLVPTLVHSKCRHSGGRFECGLRDGVKGFDP